MTDLFIGLVSHEGSRFSHNQGPQGLAWGLKVALAELGVSAIVQVNTRDDWTPELLQITPIVAQESLMATLGFEKSWQKYLNKGNSRRVPWSWLKKSAELALRHLRLRILRNSARSTQNHIEGVQRLINIELSHTKLWESGIKSRAPWILIVEDDGGCADIRDLASGISNFVVEGEALSHQHHYVNISASFTSTQLGTAHLLSPSEIAWVGLVSRQLLSAYQPITNTVCAILYSAETLSLIINEFAQMPLTPVIPIDFKLNAALISLYEQGVLVQGDCLMLEPAPIVQMSMHEMG